MGTVLSRLVAAVALTAAASVPVLSASPAEAAACSGTTGVTVVVDFHQLGGGVQQQCASDGGSAADMFGSTGFPLTRAQRDPGFICRVSGVPTSDKCVVASPSDAYWALYWNDGKSSGWVYSTSGADGLEVPAGGTVAFSWSQGGGDVPPGVSPASRAVVNPAPSSSPKPGSVATKPGSPGSSASSPIGSTPTTKTPTTGAKASTGTNVKPTRAASKAATKAASPSAAATSAPDTIASGSASPSTDASRSPSMSTPPTSAPTPTDASTSAATVPTDVATTSGADPSAADDTVATSSAAAAEDGDLPTWVAPVLVLVLFGAAGAAAVVRRRGARSSG